MPRVGSLSSPALLVLAGSLATPTSCTPTSPPGGRAASSASVVKDSTETGLVSAIPPGINSLKAAMRAARRGETGARVDGPEAPGEGAEAVQNGSRKPEVRAQWKDAARTRLTLSISQPRFFNLDKDTVAQNPGTFSPRRLATAYAAFLEQELLVCTGPTCAEIGSITIDQMMDAQTAQPADSIGDDAYVVSSMIRHTRPEEGRCTLSPSASQAGRVTYLSPKLTLQLTAEVTGAQQDSVVQVPFPGVLDDFAGAPSGMAVIENGDVVCRGGWSGSNRPPELRSMVSVPVQAFGQMMAEVPSEPADEPAPAPAPDGTSTPTDESGTAAGEASDEQPTAAQASAVPESFARPIEVPAEEESSTPPAEPDAAPTAEPDAAGDEAETAEAPEETAEAAIASAETETSEPTTETVESAESSKPVETPEAAAEESETVESAKTTESDEGAEMDGDATEEPAEAAEGAAAVDSQEAPAEEPAEEPSNNAEAGDVGETVQEAEPVVVPEEPQPATLMPAKCPADPVPFDGRHIPTYRFVSMAKGGREVTIEITQPRFFNLDHQAIKEGQPTPGWDKMTSGDTGLRKLMGEFAGFLAREDNLEFRDANGIFVGVKSVSVGEIEPAVASAVQGGCLQGGVVSAAVADQGSCVSVKRTSAITYPSAEFFVPNVRVTFVATLDYPLSAQPSHVALTYPGLFSPKGTFAGQPIGLAVLSGPGERTGRKTNVCTGSDVSPTVRAILPGLE